MRKMADVKGGVKDDRCHITDVRCRMLGSGFRLSFLHLFLFLFTSYLLPYTSFSQSVSATLDRDKILLGEQVTLELKADGINPPTAPVANWFLLPDTVNHIEVVKRSPIDTISVNGTLSYTQNITITSFDSGDWKLPPLFVLLQKSDAKKDSLFANNLTIQVLPVDVSNLKQYHPIKDIIDVEVKPDYLFISFIAALVVFAAVVLYFLFFKKKQNKQPAAQPVAARTLFATTMEQLDNLQKQNLSASLFYTKLDEICRTFIQNQLNLAALQLTSDELMIQLNTYLQGDERTQFYQLLRLMNAVKFAKYQPKEEQKTTDINTAKATVQNIYHHLQRTVPQHA